MASRATRLALVLLLPAATRAGVLAEDRADMMYHRYQGGGLTVQGPSVLVRKKFGESFAATANYYVDAISSASIDVVVSGASPYKERRDQKSLAVEYLRGKSTWSGSYLTSSENDYKASTWSLGVSQDMFGDLTTVSIGYSRGNDTISKIVDDGAGGKIKDPGFGRVKVDRHNYRVGVTQVLTRDLLLSLNFETVTEQGYLQNPYRVMRYYVPAAPPRDAFALEIFPNTRTGNAGAARLKYYLPWRAALEGQYRFYGDTWDIRAHTARLEYTHPWKRWNFSGSYRFYSQNSADFFSDLFPAIDAQNFMARDKETSALTGHTIGLGAAYEIPVGWASSWLKRGTATLRIDHMMIDYSRFTDLRENSVPPDTPVGAEPLYSLSANIIQFYLSFWF